MSGVEPQAGHQAPPPPPPTAGDEANTWAVFCHVAAFAMFLGVPFGNILGPLVVWLIKREQYPLVDDQGKESLNWQITFALAGLALTVVCLPLIFVPVVRWLVLIVLFMCGGALLILNIVLVIMAAVKASNGEAYRYPIALRLIQ